mgnify:CR=1 FL=1
MPSTARIDAVVSAARSTRRGRAVAIRGIATSTGTLHFAPVPTEANTVYLNSWKQLTTVSHLSTNVLMPPGYQRMLESNFALEVSPGLIDPPAMLVKIARDSKAALKGINAPVVISRMDSGVIRGQSRGNIFSGP